MVAHKAIRMNLPLRPGAGLAQCPQKKFPIQVVLENGFAAVPAVHHMVHRPRILDSELARHCRNAATHPMPGQEQYDNTIN
jgi:hypothetical protein